MVLIGWARRPTGMIVMAKDFLHAGGRGKDTVQKGSNVTDVILQSGHRTVL